MSLEKNIDLSMLLDFYGEMLTDRQRETVEMYANDDLSLSEIAQITGLTRPGVRDRIVKSEAALRACEAKLGLLARFLALRAEISDITAAVERKSAESGVDMTEILAKLRKLQNEEGL